jgi:predicted GH43/DUF377 family glycosyl hydrolase
MRVTERPGRSCKPTGFPKGTIEDHRVVRIGDAFCMTFAHRPYTLNCHPTSIEVPDYIPQKGLLHSRINNTRPGLAVSKDMTPWKNLGWIAPPEVDDRDNILFPEKIGGRFAMLRRPMTWFGPKKRVRLALDVDIILGGSWFVDRTDICRRPENDWEGGRIGGAAPPLRTEAGWLTLYHGVDPKSVYRVGVMLLDLKDPSKVISGCPHFIMEPETYCGKVGLIIPNVIFTTGNVIKDGTLYVHYGCADTCISVATVPVPKILRHFHKYRR